jgi:hypothetical protein
MTVGGAEGIWRQDRVLGFVLEPAGGQRGGVVGVPRPDLQSRHHIRQFYSEGRSQLPHRPVAGTSQVEAFDWYMPPPAFGVAAVSLSAAATPSAAPDA